MKIFQALSGSAVAALVLFLTAGQNTTRAQETQSVGDHMASTANVPTTVHYMRPTPVRGPRIEPAIITGPLLNGGGPVQTAPVIYVVYWGWTSDPSGEKVYLNDFLSTVGGTSWLNTVTQYSAAGNPTSLFSGYWSDSSAVPTQPTDAQIQSEALSAANHFGVGTSVNVQIVVATPTGHSTAGFGVSGGFCAYHGKIAADPNVTYTNLPYMTDAGSLCGANSVRGPLDGVSIVAGHELAESITDPLLNAWKDAEGNEIADKCAWYDLSTITTSLGTFAVQPLWSNVANGCVLSSSGDIDTPVMTQGSNMATENGFNTLGADPIGSMSPAATANGHTYIQFVDKLKASNGAYLQTNFAVSGFSADPGQSWLTSAACNVTTRLGSTATYSYSSGSATWIWTTGKMFGQSGNVNCTIIHN